MSRVMQRSALVAAINIAAFSAPLALAEEMVEQAVGEQERGSGKASATSTAVGKDALLVDAPWTTEAIRVSARGTANDWPSALATELIDADEAIAAPADFQDLVTRVPGVGATGQNGIFETF